MPAFAGAVALGYRYVETDVHVTADGVLCAFHDERLDRVTDAEGLIRELPWSTVSEARVDGLEPIPRLEDLLDAWPELRVNIDPKHDSAVDALAETLSRTGAVERVCIGSFSDRRIARLRHLLGPRLCTSLGPRRWLDSRARASTCRSAPSRAAACRYPRPRDGSPWSPSASCAPRTGGAWPCTCGRSTTPTRCAASSTWVWTAS